MTVFEQRDLDALVASIWGPAGFDRPLEPDPEVREMQNEALSIAIRMYLQAYLDDMSTDP